MTPFERNVDKYAELAVQVGVNIQEGQTLVIDAPIVAANLVRKIVEKAYRAGAHHVHVFWGDEEVKKVQHLLAPEEALAEYPSWRSRFLQEMAEAGAAFLAVYVDDSDVLNDVSPERIALANRARASALQAFTRYKSTFQVSWSTIPYATPEWSAKVFPDCSPAEGLLKLWEMLFKMARVDQDDPIQAWQQHLEELRSRQEFLNAKQYQKLRFRSTGTNLVMELPENHQWLIGALPNAKGTRFVPNIPTEEVFTMPRKESVQGVVSSSRPLNLRGTLVENFSLTFEKGRIVDIQAQRGVEALRTLIETDEGSHFLGEVALVPHQSPISSLGHIFYNTGIDENASCHLAIGNSYPNNIAGGASMSREEFESCGGNISLTHVDFMFGTSELDIEGETADGVVEPIFIHGNWAVSKTILL